MAAVKIEHVTKKIHGRAVLDDIDLEIPDGSVAGFTGVNGSGKSMLFRAVAGLVRINGGQILVGGKLLDRMKAYPVRLGYMADGTGFWEYRSGKSNLEILAGIRKLIGFGEIEKTLELVGLDADDGRPVSEYSLGMKQRLNLAQAIMEEPELLIMDEPTNALDTDGIELVRDIVQKMHASGVTLLISCHNQPQLEDLFDLHVHLRDGRIVGKERRYEDALQTWA